MSIPQSFRGTLKADGTVELQQRPNLPAGPVDVVLRPIATTAPSGEDWWQYLQRVRGEAESTGGPFRSEAEIESEREAFRNGDHRPSDVDRLVDEQQGNSPE